MTQEAMPGFQLGDRAFLADGRSGEITATRTNEETGEVEHLIEGVFEFFTEAQLSREVPGVTFFDPVLLDLPPPVGTTVPLEEIGPVTLVQVRLRDEGVLSTLRRELASKVDLDQVRGEVLNAANLTAQANLALHISQVEGRAADLDLFIAARFSELESTVTTTLSEIEKRSTDLEAVAEESSGFGFFGFVGGLGGLIKDPVSWIMSRLGDHISSEVNDGLNR